MAPGRLVLVSGGGQLVTSAWRRRFALVALTTVPVVLTGHTGARRTRLAARGPSPLQRVAADADLARGAPRLGALATTYELVVVDRHQLAAGGCVVRRQPGRQRLLAAARSAAPRRLVGGRAQRRRRRGRRGQRGQRLAPARRRLLARLGPPAAPTHLTQIRITSASAGRLHVCGRLVLVVVVVVAVALGRALEQQQGQHVGRMAPLLGARFRHQPGKLVARAARWHLERRLASRVAGLPGARQAGRTRGRAAGRLDRLERARRQPVGRQCQRAGACQLGARRLAGLRPTSGGPRTRRQLQALALANQRRQVQN